MSRSNETRHIKWHETCKCICRLDGIFCNNKQRWNDDKCRFECKEFIDKGVCNKGFILNPSNCEWECNKSCDIGEYLDYSNCKCKKKIVDPLVEECTENIRETKLNETWAKNEHKCSSCTLYIVLFWIFFIFSVINIGIGTYFAHYKYLSCNKENFSRYDYPYQTTI